jgi:Kef-type K+ transport system membrane component KefB
MLAAYAVMLLGAIGIFFVVAHVGGPLTAPPAAPMPAGAPLAAAPNTLLRLLVALTAVIVTGQLLARVLAYVGQPPVIGEVAAGILLGPSLIGPELSAIVLPPSIAPFLGVVAQIGVILYMFLVGLELYPGQLKHRARVTIATSHASIVLPFVLGALLALLLYPRLSTSDVPFTSFALFMGVAMSITAFPVLARILTDRGMSRTDLGVVALTCAAVDDVTAWCLLAFVVGVVRAQPGNGLWVAAGALSYILFMVFVARPLMARVVQRWQPAESSTSAVVLFVALLVSALITEAIGIHAIFGAFLLGAIVPHDSEAAKALSRQLRDLVTVLLLPAFFAFTGMRTRIDLLSDGTLWLFCGLIILVATAGKFVGSFAAARLTGMPSREAAILGTLMNTRGLMELIVLNIGLELRVISPTLFAMMVIMAIVTTMATSPIVSWLMRVPLSHGR